MFQDTKITFKVKKHVMFSFCTAQDQLIHTSVPVHGPGVGDLVCNKMYSINKLIKHTQKYTVYWD